MDQKTFEARVLHLALTSPEPLTVSRVSLTLGVPIGEAQQSLDRMARAGYLEIESDNEGRLIYNMGVPQTQSDVGEGRIGSKVDTKEEVDWNEAWSKTVGMAEPMVSGAEAITAQPAGAFAASTEPPLSINAEFAPFITGGPHPGSSVQRGPSWAPFL